MCICTDLVIISHANSLDSLNFLIDGISAGVNPFGGLLPSGNLGTNLYIGGISPESENLLPSGMIDNDGFKGCLDGVRVLGRPLDFSMNVGLGGVALDVCLRTSGNEDQDVYTFAGSAFATYGWWLCIESYVFEYISILHQEHIKLITLYGQTIVTYYSSIGPLPYDIMGALHENKIENVHVLCFHVNFKHQSLLLVPLCHLSTSIFRHGPHSCHVIATVFDHIATFFMCTHHCDGNSSGTCLLTHALN